MFLTCSNTFNTALFFFMTWNKKSQQWIHYKLLRKKSLTVTKQQVSNMGTESSKGSAYRKSMQNIWDRPWNINESFLRLIWEKKMTDLEKQNYFGNLKLTRRTHTEAWWVFAGFQTGRLRFEATYLFIHQTANTSRVISLLQTIPFR